MYGNDLIILSFSDQRTQVLIKQATAARLQAYAPYSKFQVGAALRTDTKTVYTGCNVESKVFSPTVCAERTAICKAVSEGHRKMAEIAVVADQGDNFTTPCGVCREVLWEFGSPDMDIYMTKPDMQKVLHMKLSELLPMAFVSSFE